MDHTYELMRRKVDGFDRDTFESSLQLGTKVLGQLGYQQIPGPQTGQNFQTTQPEVIQELCHHHGEDEKKYLSEAKKYASELEELLRTEKEEASHDLDNSWDVITLREEIREIYAEMDKGKRQCNLLLSFPARSH